MDTNSKSIFYVLSDLHMAEGNVGRGTYKGTENFFADQYFSDLIDHLLNKHKDEFCELIINGDFVDFIRITTPPESVEDISAWQAELDKLDFNFDLTCFKASWKEKRYGLGTNNYKCIWKLYLIIKGHEKVFNALAKWVYDGHSLNVVVGNHDPEWYWPLVQKYLILRLKEMAVNAHSTCGKISEKSVIFNLKGFEISPSIWIEHGHNREYMTSICPEYELDLCDAWMKWPRRFSASKFKESWQKQLDIPFGSFWNRYLVNRVELSFPFINNMKSNTNIASVLFKEYPLETLKLFFSYGLFAVLIIPKSYRKFLAKSMVFVLLNLLPIAFLGWFIYTWYQSDQGLFNIESKWLSRLVNSAVAVSVPIVLKLVLNYVFKKAGLINKPLDQVSQEDILSQSNYDVVLMGHNHYPQHIIFNVNGKEKQYLNTGTWTSLYALDIRDVRIAPEYTVAKIDLKKNLSGLYNWDPIEKSLVEFQSINPK